MADLTRRGFLTQMSVTTGVGIVGGIGLRQLLTPQGEAPAIPIASTPSTMPSQIAAPAPMPLEGVTLAGPMMVHVRDVPTGEVSLMVGTQELVYRDPDLVSRLVRTAASATRAEG